MTDKDWTLESRIAYDDAIRVAYKELAEERDRRYREVDIEREKALKIKETADLAALTLASENQRLRDEAHNGILNQWRDERTLYATKTDIAALDAKWSAQITPLQEFHSSQAGRKDGSLDARSLLFSVIGLIGVAAVVLANVIH